MSADTLDVRLFDAGDGVTYSFLLSVDDAWKLALLTCSWWPDGDCRASRRARIAAPYHVVGV
jgi:hypothetical protein